MKHSPLFVYYIIHHHSHPDSLSSLLCVSCGLTRQALPARCTRWSTVLFLALKPHMIKKRQGLRTDSQTKRWQFSKRARATLSHGFLTMAHLFPVYSSAALMINTSHLLYIDVESENTKYLSQPCQARHLLN